MRRRLVAFIFMVSMALVCLAEDAAQFLSQSVPTRIHPGESFPVSITLHNNSNTTTWPWGSDYRLGAQNWQDNTTWGGGAWNRVNLPYSVPPQQNVTFSFWATAPSTPGWYNFQWQMVHDGVAWFGDYTTNVVILVSGNEAQFVSQSVPPNMPAGQASPVVITMRNVGTSTWSAGGSYSLGSQSGQDNLTWGTNRISLPYSVAPQQTVDVAVNVTAPPTLGVQPFQWRMVQDGWEWFGDYTTLAYVNVVSPPPAVQPTLVHGTNLTADCAEQYCIKLYGFNIASNAIVEMRYGGPTGDIVSRTTAYVRGASGEATTLELPLSDPNLRWRFDPPGGLYFIIENPGNPPARTAALHFTRDHEVKIRGYLDVFNGRGAAGWVCGDDKLSAQSLDVQVHEGGVYNPTPLLEVFANQIRPDVASVCGGATARGFSFYWPVSWKTGVARQFYLVGTFEDFWWVGGDDANERAIIPGTPRTFAIPNTPFDAVFIAHQVPGVVPPGATGSASVTMKNLGTSTWAVGSQKLGSQNPANNSRWGLTAAALPAPVSPGGNAAFAFNIAAPTTNGIYDFQWQMQSGSTFFGDLSPNLQIRVEAPPTFYPNPSFPPTF